MVKKTQDKKFSVDTDWPPTYDAPLHQEGSTNMNHRSTMFTVVCRRVA